MGSRQLLGIASVNMAAVFLLLAGTLPFPAGEPVPENCCNFVDDDADSKIDSSDTDCASHPPCMSGNFHRGDVRQNGRIDVTDAILILGFLFGGSPVGCQEAADVDDDGQVLVTDAILLLRYLFSDGPPPAPPGPPGEPCGLDPTGSPSLGCSTYGSCNV